MSPERNWCGIRFETLSNITGESNSLMYRRDMVLEATIMIEFFRTFVTGILLLSAFMNMLCMLPQIVLILECHGTVWTGNWGALSMIPFMVTVVSFTH